jgi:ribosomal silencing factor RsfS
MARTTKEAAVLQEGREGTPAFNIHVRGVTQRVRSALAEALAAVGADATKPQSIARQLKLDKSLAWKAARIVTDTDPFAAIPRLPGRSGVKILMESLDAASAPQSMMSELRDAMSEFDKMVVTHAGSRETLQMMLANVSKEGQAERDEAHRKMAFQGNSAIWGVQARVQLGLHFVAPNAKDSSRLDLGTISGLIDFKRLRQDAPWAVAYRQSLDDEGRPIRLDAMEPIDDSVEPNEVPVLKAFCSSSLPKFRAQPTNKGAVRFEIGAGPVGITGSATCVTGWINRSTATYYAQPDDQFGELMVHLNTPVEVLIHDCYVHRSLDLHDPETLVYSQLPGGLTYPSDGREFGILPIAGDIIDLGDGLTNLTTAEVPRFRPMVETALARIGHSASDFRGIRFRLRYPPIPTLSVMRYHLPERE